MRFIEEKLGKLYEVSSGISISPEKYGRGYPFLTFMDIFSSPYIKKELKTLVDSTEKDRFKSSIKCGDVFLTRTSETEDELGMSTVALVDYPNATFNGFSKRLRPKSKLIVPIYAVYYFRSPYFRTQTKKMASLITRASLNNSNIAHLSIKYPTDLEIQRKLGTLLYNYDLLIENNNTRIKILEQLANSLYKEWFVRFRFPGYKNCKFVNGQPRGWRLASNAKKMEIPYGWKYSDLSRISSFVRGKNITSANMIGGDIPVISAGIEPSGYHNVANVFGNSLTISSSGANAGYLLFHQKDIWAADCSYCQSKYIWFVYSQLKFLQPVLMNMQVGTAQPHVYPKNINQISSIIPDNYLIELFEKKIDPIFDEIRILQNKNDNLTKQRDLLLPRLMSGKLEVK